MASQTAPSSIFSQKTLIPMSFIVCIAPFVYWLTTVANLTEQNYREISYMKQQRTEFDDKVSRKMDDQNKMLYAVHSDVSAIDAKVSILVDYFRAGPSASRRGH